MQHVMRWMVEPRPCAWRQGRLTQLYLPSAGLECAFPAALAQLTELTALDLTFNRLSGRCATAPRDPALCLSEPGCMVVLGI